ncbi:RecB family nuclease and DNA segregation ATPase FtsK [Candidatus Magnetobacterium bavaricum]|uniref:RecB family nuclease and DNA segregation ATPase FtsK n=1 Tax=Candidatus Magnetobacterium bavaricum TaxID=29290 RepID=A0A0F3GR25_9BACT|nr:RecB family nuclease and DNA segregation ATPase FtsK [Candidatus Magnetobacterium bavaricum]
MKKNHRQLEAFTLGILKKLIISGVKDKLIKKENIPISSSELRNIPYEKSEKSKKLLDWVKENIAILEKIFYGQIEEHDIRLSDDSKSTWLSVLFTYTYYIGDYHVRQNCIDWLIGGKFDQDEANKIGIKISNSSIKDENINELYKDRIKDFCELARFFRPFVFCIDQTEIYAKDERLVRSLGTLIQELVDYFYNHMTVVTAIKTTWEKKIKDNMDDSNLDRLSNPPITLQGMVEKQAEELINKRLKEAKCEDKKATFIDNGSFLRNLFEGESEIGVRKILTECSRRWIEIVNIVDPPPPLPTIKELYDNYVEKEKQESIVFKPDTFRWLVKEAANGLTGLKVTEYNAQTLHWSLSWRLFYFGFEAGSHHSTWQAIAREANRLFVHDKNTKVVMFRITD